MYIGAAAGPPYDDDGQREASGLPRRYVCMYVCMCVCVCVCVCMYACMHACMYVCMYIFIYLCLCVCMYVCMYVYRCIDVCICVYGERERESARDMCLHTRAPTRTITQACATCI